MAYTPIPAAASGGLPTDLTYNDVTHVLLLEASEDAGDVSSGVSNSSNTASSTATLRATTGASAGAARVEMVRGAVTAKWENRDGTMYGTISGSDYVHLNRGSDAVHISGAGTVTTNNRQVVTSHWNAASGILAGPSLQSQCGANERLNILAGMSAIAGAPSDGKGLTIYSHNSSASLFRRVLDFVHRAGPPILKLCDQEGNVEIGVPGATTATDGFLLMGSCAGVPTGVPASITADMIPFRYNRTANTICAYNGAWRSTAALT